MSNSQGFYAVSSAVALLLAGAGYNTYTQMTGSTPPVASASACDTYAFSSSGDPHIVSALDGQETVTTRNESQANVETTQNTSGGQTQIATTVTNTDSVHDGNGLVASNSYNQVVTVTHGQSGVAGYWQLNATGTSSVSGIVTDASGSHAVTAGKPITEPDGTTIQMQNGAIVVVQKLSLGGIATTSITENGAGLNVSTAGTGVAVVDGTAVQQGVGSNNALINGQTCAGGGQAPALTSTSTAQNISDSNYATSTSL